jgi:acyl transferase domain-containing protein
MSDGVDAITEVPADRWDINAFYDPDPETPGKTYSRSGGFLDKVDDFDEGFFGVSPNEARVMDPQQKLLLEVSWEALERAGQTPEKLTSSRTGVFIGLSSYDYGLVVAEKGASRNGSSELINASHSIAVGRLSHLLNLRGPCLALDTACSSSLVAIHLACQSLRDEECALALAGGINVILTPDPMITFARARMLSADGRCKTFDAAADGFARGEGCGVVVLKRLRDAIADNDNILALIRGSAINHDGRGNALTVPNGPAQSELIKTALARAGVAPGEVDYVEAHGTGTALGDPIELRALAGVFAPRLPAQPLLLGSVKTNVGHLEAAAGVASLIKVVLALNQAQIPPHLHLQKLTPHVPWNEWPLQVPTTLTPWPTRDSGRRLAGVSSFGINGTNAHLVVENFSPPASPGKADATPSFYILPLSARSELALRQLAARFAQHLQAHPEQELDAICHTAAAGRAHHRYRLAAVGRTAAELSEQLRVFATEGANTPSLVTGSVPAQLKQSAAQPAPQLPSNERRDGEQYRQFLLSLATHYVNGGLANWQQLLTGPTPRKLALPTYPFQHK